MAWGNYNPMSGFPAMQQNVVQNYYMPIVVHDREEAKSYPMAANTTVSMTTPEFGSLWIKTTNASGIVVSFREFTLAEVVEEKPQYITKSDFEAFKKELFESLGGK